MVYLRNLRAVRERRFLSQGDLADRAGLTRATVSRIELGRLQPRFSTVRRLAAALGVEPAELVGEEPPQLVVRVGSVLVPA